MVMMFEAAICTLDLGDILGGWKRQLQGDLPRQAVKQLPSQYLAEDVGSRTSQSLLCRHLTDWSALAIVIVYKNGTMRTPLLADVVSFRLSVNVTNE